MLCSGPICKYEDICDATSNDRLDQSTIIMMKWVDLTGLRKMAPTEIGRFCAVRGQNVASAKPRGNLPGGGFEKCPANGGPKRKILERHRKTFEDSCSGGGSHRDKFS